MYVSENQAYNHRGHLNIVVPLFAQVLSEASLVCKECLPGCRHVKVYKLSVKDYNLFSWLGLYATTLYFHQRFPEFYQGL